MMVINIIVRHGSVMRYYEGRNMRRHVQGAGGSESKRRRNKNALVLRQGKNNNYENNNYENVQNKYT